MRTSSLQDYCLQLMGIAQWQQQNTKEYGIFIDEVMNHEKNQLLERMLLALKWSKNLCQIEVCQPSDLVKKLTQARPKKALMFGDAMVKALGLTIQENPFSFESVEIALLPSLNDLLINAGLKKQAWQIMQKLM